MIREITEQEIGLIDIHAESTLQALKAAWVPRHLETKQTCY